MWFCAEVRLCSIFASAAFALVHRWRRIGLYEGRGLRRHRDATWAPLPRCHKSTAMCSVPPSSLFPFISSLLSLYLSVSFLLCISYPHFFFAARDKRYCIMEVPAACVPDNAKVSSLTHVKDPLNLLMFHTWTTCRLIQLGSRLRVAVCQRRTTL